MSRYHTKTEQGIDVVYGFDHALGYFYEEWDGKEDVPSVDLDTMFSGLDRGFLIKLLNQTNAPEEHKRLIALDLPL